MKNFKTILLTLTIIYCYSGYSQTKIKCEDVLKKELNLDASPDNLQKLIDSICLLENCGLDHIDINFFSKKEMIGTLLIDLLSEKDSILTYKNLYNKISRIVESDEYKENKPLLKVYLDLENRPADINNWEQDKLLFQQINVPLEYLNEFYDYLKEHSNQNKTYKVLFANFRKKQKQKKETETTDFKGIFKNVGNVDYEDLLKESIKQNKPLLLYFTGYACINCRKMENSTFSDLTILKQLNNDFYFVNLHVDDKKQLPENEWKISDFNGKTIKNIGQKNSNLQMTKFSVNAQPYFVIIDKNGNKIAEQGYTPDKETFKKFLNSIK